MVFLSPRPGIERTISAFSKSVSKSEHFEEILKLNCHLIMKSCYDMMIFGLFFSDAVDGILILLAETIFIIIRPELGQFKRN